MGHTQVARQGTVWGGDIRDWVKGKNILFTREGLLPIPVFVFVPFSLS